MTMMILTLHAYAAPVGRAGAEPVGRHRRREERESADRGRAAEKRRGARSGADAAPGRAGGQTPPAPTGDQPAHRRRRAGYSYDPAGRRDPFVSLTGSGGDVPIRAAPRPAASPDCSSNEITVKGVLKSPKGGFIATRAGPDNRTYIVHSGDKVFDG